MGSCGSRQVSLPQGGTFPPSVPGGVVPALPVSPGLAQTLGFCGVPISSRGHPAAQTTGFIPPGPGGWNLASRRGRSLLRPPSWACGWPSPSHVLQGRPSECVCVLSSSSYQDPSPVGLKSTLGTEFYLNYFFKDRISKYTHVLSN